MGNTQNASGRRITLRELTLRQLGHMTADLAFEEKMYWLKALDDIGVEETIVWGVDDDAADLIKAKRDAGLKIGIGFYGKVYFPEATREILDLEKNCDADLVCLNGRGAPFSLEEMGWSEQQMLEGSVTAVRDAKERGLKISIGLAYSSQATPGYVADVAEAVEAAGADTFYLPDSLGVASPEN